MQKLQDAYRRGVAGGAAPESIYTSLFPVENVALGDISRKHSEQNHGMELVIPTVVFLEVDTQVLTWTKELKPQNLTKYLLLAGMPDTFDRVIAITDMRGSKPDLPWRYIAIGAASALSGWFLCLLVDWLRDGGTKPNRSSWWLQCELSPNHLDFFFFLAHVYDLSTDFTFTFLTLAQQPELYNLYRLSCIFLGVYMLVNVSLVFVLLLTPGGGTDANRERQQRLIFALLPPPEDYRSGVAILTGVLMGAFLCSFNALKVLSSNMWPGLFSSVHQRFTPQQRRRLFLFGLIAALVEDVPQFCIMIQAARSIGVWSKQSLWSFTGTVIALIYTVISSCLEIFRHMRKRKEVQPEDQYVEVEITESAIEVEIPAARPDIY